MEFQSVLKVYLMAKQGSKLTKKEKIGKQIISEYQ